MAFRIQTFLVLLTVFIAYGASVPTEKKDRTLDKGLSDVDHEVGGEHNPDYDHDAFLGHEEKEAFDNLTPEESKQRLGIIVDKIDKNGDGQVTEEELREWIKYVQRHYIVTDTDRMWKDHAPDADGTLTWAAYKKRTFGYEDEPDQEGSRTESYADMINRDRRRWDKADANKDGKLDKEEFSDFLHPEDADHMHDIVVMETIEDIDKNKDGSIDLEEYIADMWGGDDDDEDDDDDEEDEGEPDWVATERDQFKNFRDKNGDGKLDHGEVQAWLIPDDYDHSASETKHLIKESDNDLDGILSKEEILENYELFVGSQATDFGEALRKHDEF